MKGIWIAELISAALYAALAAGLWLLLWNGIRAIWQKGRMKRRLAVSRRPQKEENAMEAHLRKALATVWKNPCSPQIFLAASGGAAFVVLFTGLGYGLGMAAWITALLAGALPYGFLRVRLAAIRRKGSYEGEKLVSEFLRQYRISAFNIYETLERLVSAAGETKICGKLLFRMLLELRSTGDPEGIRRVCDTFAYGIHTNWSRMLADNIRISAGQGTNVSLAVEDILIQLREARVLAEERKRLNGESVRITLILIPLLYGATVLLSVQYLELSPAQFLKNQIGTPEGFVLLMAILLLFLVNWAILELVNNQKFDY